MAKESRDGINELLASRGVSRRDFLGYCGALTAMLGLSEAMAPQIASALEATLPRPQAPVIWLGLGLCTGCTESMAQINYPDVPTVVLDLLSIDYWETTMAAAGESAEKAKTDLMASAKGKYVAVVEGTVMTGADGNTLRIAGKTGNEHLEEIAKDAFAIVAVGSCAVDGGWVRGRPNPAGGMGVAEYLKSKNIATPVINLPTCPVNPEWIVAVVVDAIILGKLPELDGQGRPKLIFGSSIHDNCPRRGHFENGEFVEQFGTPEEAKGYCLYKVGCKGPQTFTNCPVVRWNRKQSWCVDSGSPCIGCGNLNWTDNDGPFLDRMRSLPLGSLGNVRPETLAYAVGGVAAVGLVAHGLGMNAAGRIGDGPPMEEKKAYDRKREKKGGGK
jgi:hydrogenase small subunit